MIQNEEHQKLVDEILYKVGSLPHVRLWTRIVGTFRGLYNENKFKVGTDGEADIQGILSPHGKMIAIECKTGKAKLSQEQIKWKNMVEKFGGIYIEARSVNDVMQRLLR